MSDEEAEKVLGAMMKPPYRREVPRVAEPLRQVELHELAGPQGRIAAWRVGEGPAVLLVHGYEDDNAVWTPMIDALRARECAVVAFDLPGHGLSDGDNGYSSAGAEAVTAVARDLGPIDSIVAHSLGCWAAVLAVSEGLDVRRLVLISAPLSSSLGRWRAAAERMGLPPEAGERAQELARQHLKPLHRKELGELVAGLETPILFVHSRDDERVGFEDAERVSDGCKNALFFPLEGADHRETPRESEAIAAAVMFLDDR